MRTKGCAFTWKHVAMSEKFKFELYSNICQLLSICYHCNMDCYCSWKCKANNHHSGHTMHIQFKPNWFVRVKHFGAHSMTQTNRIITFIYEENEKEKGHKKENNMNNSLFRQDKAKLCECTFSIAKCICSGGFFFAFSVIQLQWALKVPENNQITFIWPLNNERCQNLMHLQNSSQKYHL